MEEQKTEVQELIPGTNIPRPRNRNIGEEEAEYVEYLRAYYDQYFPNEVAQNTLPEANEDISSEKDENIVSDEMMQTIEKGLEQYVDDIHYDSAMENPDISFDVESEQEVVSEDMIATDKISPFSFDIEAPKDVDTPDISFSFDVTPDAEFDSFTNSNEVLSNKIRTPQFFKKVTTFFQNAKETANRILNQISEYYEEIDFSQEGELTPSFGRSR